MKIKSTVIYQSKDRVRFGVYHPKIESLCKTMSLTLQIGFLLYLGPQDATKLLLLKWLTLTSQEYCRKLDAMIIYCFSSTGP